VLNYEFARLGLALDWPFTRICTIHETLHLKGYRLSLKELHTALFPPEAFEPHRAKPDVLALTRCFLKLREQGIIP
jgi:hypothetical protein